MIHDSSSDSDEDANFCGNPEQFDALFKQLKNNLMAGQSSPVPESPAEPPGEDDNSNDVPEESSPTSNKKSKAERRDRENGDDIHEVSTDSCGSNDPDLENVLAEYHEAIRSCRTNTLPSTSTITHTLQPQQNAQALTSLENDPTSTKRMTRATAKKAAPPAPPVEVVIGDDDDIQVLPTPANANHVNASSVPSTSSSRRPAPGGPVVLTTQDCLDDDILEVISVQREQITVRIRWKGKVHRVKAYETDSISRVKELLSEVIGGSVPANEIMLYMNDNEIPLESWKTLKEIRLEFTTVLEALRRAPHNTNRANHAVAAAGAGVNSVDVDASFEEEEAPYDPTMVALKIQDGNLRKKNIVIYVKKTAPLTNLRELYLEKAGLRGTKTVEQIKFMFDGDVVDLSETPNSLDFEDDECLDVVIK